jgi:glutathione S-transferase
LAIVLYDLAGTDPEIRFSPYCWRIRMALAHKGLEADARPWRFTETETLVPTGGKTVPAMNHDGKWVVDSWAIANYLEENFPDRPSLFGGEAGRALARFYNEWTAATLHGGIIRLVLADIHAVLGPKDQAYFRQSREARFGTTLEAFVADREQRLPEFRKSLGPLRATLQAQPFLGGDAPLYPDYIVFGGFQWARSSSNFELLEADDPVALWRDRLLDAFGGMARRAKRPPRQVAA